MQNEVCIKCIKDVTILTENSLKYLKIKFIIKYQYIYNADKTADIFCNWQKGTTTSINLKMAKYRFIDIWYISLLLIGYF